MALDSMSRHNAPFRTASRSAAIGVWRSLDWWTVGIYLALLAFGWLSVCGASYDFDTPDLFALSTHSGMQIVWIGTSVVLGMVLLLLDDRVYDTFSYLVYAVLVLLLFVTIFNPNEIKGSRSWLVMGPLRVQPAEFAKFATALAVAKLMSVHGFTMSRSRDMMRAFAVVLLPMLLIVMQKETGSALVYLAFFLMFYREGMTGSFLFTGVAFVIYFVVGVRYKEVLLFDTTTSVGDFVVALLTQAFTLAMVWIYGRDRMATRHAITITIAATVVALLVAQFVVPFNLMWVQLAISVALMGWLLWLWIGAGRRNYLYILVFALCSTIFFHATDPVLNKALKPYQRDRVNVLLGVVDDPRNIGYNVNQSKIAIGSGGLTGKGFLNGTQTKLRYVPEQHTDFIFCTVGEEEGFLGSATVLLLFLALILRLIHIAERQPMKFGRVYAYCVASIFLFHLFVNVGMVMGLTPVIGIPLPFFSYGGSSLWGFTILLFILLRIDAGRNSYRR